MEGIADYRFTGELGSGNHGRFYLARPPQRLGIDEEFVAVKVLDRNANEADFERIATELRIFHAVRSEHLVRIHDAGSDGGLLFYAMPYYAEGSLDAPAITLTTDDEVRIVADAARGAHDLHENGVVHRDIKPANILIEGGGGRLADLGLARLLSPGMTSTGIGPIGSIEYMSPDAILGKRASRATDLWALGVTLHHVLADTGIYGEIPGTNVMEAFTYVLRTSPTLDPALPEGYRVIVERCLGLADPYPTAAALAEDLDAAVPR